MMAELTKQQEYDRRRYLANRDAIIARQREYYREYLKKGLSKPRKKRQPRSTRDHERYLEKRDEILAKQKIYRDTHKEEIKQRRHERGYLKYVMKLQEL